jgi:hypothetical protein
MMTRAMLAVAYAAGRAFHARQVKGDDPDKKGYPGPSGWELGMRLTTSPHKKKILLPNLKDMTQNGYLGNDMKQYRKVCG